MRYLDRFRTPSPRPAPGRLAACLLALLLMGAAMGVLAKWLDFVSEIFGNMLSQLPFWVLLGLLIARFSGGPGRAAAYAFAFFASMLAGYYLAAEWMGGVYGMAFVYGWSVVACLSPFAAFAAWYAFGRGWLPNLLSVGIVAAAVLADVVLFRSVDLEDALLVLLCAILLFSGKIKGHKR